VAKDVALVPVRVLDCTASGEWSTIIAGVEWVTANHVGTSVANFSIGRPDVFPPLVQAVQASIASGVTYVLSAGNNSMNACGHSPGGSVPTGITVGATSQGDFRVGGTNFGPCLDISAPGEEIVSAGHDNDTDEEFMDGTSFAAGHVTGVVALHLEDNRNHTPAQVKSVILAAATPKEPGEDGPSRGSPARILFSRV
jgi:subtilisin family serine protease